MQKTIITILILSLILLTGCSNSYQSCVNDCERVTKQRFEYIETVDGCEWEVRNNALINCYYIRNPDRAQDRYYEVTRINRTARTQHCYEQCKPQEVNSDGD